MTGFTLMLETITGGLTLRGVVFEMVERDLSILADLAVGRRCS